MATVTCLLVSGLGGVFTVTQWDRASRIATVVSALAAVAAVGVAVWAAISGRFGRLTRWRLTTLEVVGVRLPDPRCSTCAPAGAGPTPIPIAGYSRPFDSYRYQLWGALLTQRARPGQTG